METKDLVIAALVKALREDWPGDISVPEVVERGGLLSTVSPEESAAVAAYFAG